MTGITVKSEDINGMTDEQVLSAASELYENTTSTFVKKTLIHHITRNDIDEVKFFMENWLKGQEQVSKEVNL